MHRVAIVAVSIRHEELRRIDGSLPELDPGIGQRDEEIDEIHSLFESQSERRNGGIEV